MVLMSTLMKLSVHGRTKNKPATKIHRSYGERSAPNRLTFHSVLKASTSSTGSHQFISVKEPEAGNIILHSSRLLPDLSCPHQGLWTSLPNSAVPVALFSLRPVQSLPKSSFCFSQCLSCDLFSKLQAQHSFLKYKLLTKPYEVCGTCPSIPLWPSPLLRSSTLAGLSDPQFLESGILSSVLPCTCCSF